MVQFPKSHFSGAGHIHGSQPGDLYNMVAEIFGREAKTAVGGETAFTDNSAGTAFVDRAAGAFPVTPAPELVGGGTDAAPKAGFETALGTLRNAIAVVAKEIIDVAALIPIVTLTPESVDDWGGGTIAVEGTIAAITQATTAVTMASGNAINGAGAAVVCENYEKALATLTHAQNQIADACYYVARVEMPNAFGGKGIFPLDITLLDAFLATDTGTATVVDGESFLDATGEAWLAACANLIATLAEVHDDAVDNTLPVQVHAATGVGA